MRFKDDIKFSKITLSESYNNNYKVLFENSSSGEDGVHLFNNIPIFKYKKLIIKYSEMPSENEIKHEIENFMNKINSEGQFKVFSIKANKVEKYDNINEYIVNVAFISFS